MREVARETTAISLTSMQRSRRAAESTASASRPRNSNSSPRVPKDQHPARAKHLRTGRPRPAALDHRSLACGLIKWFGIEARDLPWRRSSDPYAIWVSEVMLQQTQVATVIPYWERWLKAFPTVEVLAQAPEARVLKLWEGLGYYSRARNLQRAAQVILRDHAGRMPAQPEVLRQLPGIGPYTAGAVASIAFNLPEPVLDGNVIRVLTRLRAWFGDPKARELQARLWTEARHFVEAAAAVSTTGPRGNCSALNQGLMELGATVCTPTKPQCSKCPWESVCQANVRGLTVQLPESSPRAVTETRRFATALLRHQDRWLVRQRPEGMVNAGYWEFPNLEVLANDEPLSALAGWLGIPADSFTSAGTLRHAITRYRMTQHLFRAEVPRALPLPDARWVSLADLEALALTGPHRRLARTL